MAVPPQEVRGQILRTPLPVPISDLKIKVLWLPFNPHVRPYLSIGCKWRVLWEASWTRPTTDLIKKLVGRVDCMITAHQLVVTQLSRNPT